MAHIVFAPDSFKGSVSAVGVCAALEAGWRSVRPDDEFTHRPMADGGEGTLDAFLAAVPGAERRAVVVTGPDGSDVESSWALLPDGTGVVELGNTSGIELLGEVRMPMDAHTLGFGQAIAAALDAGVSRLVVGIGSSASTDGGAGMLLALGARILDSDGAELGPSPRDIARAAAVDLTGLRPLPSGGVRFLCDVDNPLLGARGAAAVFGPQKGADEAQVAALDHTLARWAEILIASADAPADAAERPGAGAAGGTGFALALWGAERAPGSEAVADLLGLDAAIAGADVVVTGEGSYDGQSAAGKVPAHVATVARARDTPTGLVAGRIADDADLAPFAATASLTTLAGSAAAAMSDAPHWLHVAGAALATQILGRP